MIIHTVNQTVANANAEQFYDFMINPSDERYSAWWPGEHLNFHIVKRGEQSHLGDIVYFNERLGEKHRLKFHAIVVKVERPKAIAWQMRAFGVKLPAVVELRLCNSQAGLLLCHELRLGYRGIGKLFDFVIRLYFNKSFQMALEKHCDIEWHKLSNLLRQK